MATKTSTSKPKSRRAQRRTSQMQLLIGLVIAAVGAVALLIFLTTRPTASGAEVDFQAYPQETITEGGALGFALGEPDAPVTVADYSDYSCPHCFDFSPVLQRIINEYVPGGSVRVIYYPVVFVNPTTSIPAAKAMTCAGEQGRAWEMHDELWRVFGTRSRNAFTDSILQQEAELLGLNMGDFVDCYNNPELDQTLITASDVASANGVNATPTVQVNGERVTFSSTGRMYEELSAAIERELEAAGES